MKTYLVAGGAGFIGTNLCERLLQDGHKVICMDNLVTGSENNVEHLLEKKNFVFVNHDVVKHLPQIHEKIDGIFHLASPASPNTRSRRSYMALPIETLMVNSVGTKNLLDLAVSKNCRLVYASSSEVYGDPAISPQSEDYFGNVSPNGPRSVYDEGKRFGEAICMAYVRKFDADVVMIRIFNTYGPRMQKDDGRVVSNFINQALLGDDITIYGTGEQTRSFCYVTDLVEGWVKAMETPEASGEVLNLGNDGEYNVIELAQKVIDMTESSSKIIHEDLPIDDPRKRRPDLSRAEKILGYSPKVSLDEGLKKTIEYFRNN